MADQDYHTKLESLRRYIPFLVNMMSELKAKGNREAQLNKIQSLHDMITDTRKKLKLETLNRCEEVLTNIYYKVNPHYKNKGLPNSKTLPGIDSPNESSTLPGIESPKSTPTSPSPTRDVLRTKPVNIPMEKVNTPTFGLGSLSARKSHLPKIDVYSNVVINTAKVNTLAAKVPDMSKPPISLDDLKTLEDDVHQKISDATFANASVDDLQAYRKELELQLRVDSVTATMNPEKTDIASINTTVRNNPSLSKKISFTDSKSKTQESSKTPINFTTPIKEIKSPTKLSKDIDTMSTKLLKDKSPQKVVKDNSGIFGSLLSSIDNKLMEDTKKTKKSERRSSLNLSKDDSGSTTSLSSNMSDIKDTKTAQVDKPKESKKSSGSHKHKKSSVDKEKHKNKDKSKDNSKHRTDSEKSKKDKKKSKKEKHKSKERRDEDKKTKNSSKGDDGSVGEDNGKDAKKKSDVVLLSDILLYRSKFCSNQDMNPGAKEGSWPNRDPDCNKSNSPSSTTLDLPVNNKSDTTSTTSTTTVERPKPAVPLDVPKATPIYKRLADKYNPKPKSKIAENDIPDVDKAVSDSIEKFMKVSPARPLLSPLSEPKHMPGENILQPASQTHTVLPVEQPRPVQLPEILQKIFSKPLLGDLIPKRLNENMFPLTTAAQNKALSLGVNPLTKPGAILPPEPPILSPPRRPLSFQPPDNPRNFPNFVSPPQRQEFLPNQEMGARANILLPAPGSQHGHIPTPPIPPSLPRGFSDHNAMMDIVFGTPRVDFDTPSTPLPDFDSPRVDFDSSVHLRNEFNVNQRFMPSGHQERQMNCFDPRNQNYMAQPQFQPQPEVNVYNNQLVPGMGYYGAPNQIPLHNPELPHYRPDQNYFQERNWQENSRWARRPGDPRNYREYKEMRERQEREAKAQEKQKEIKDPRLAPRDSKDGTGDKDVVRDPRLIRDSVDKSVGDKSETSIKDPRLSRGREKSVDRERDRDKTIEQDKEDFKSREFSAKGRESRERIKGRERAISGLRGFSDSKGSRPVERESRFDKMYSRTNRAKSRSPSRDDKNDEEESFISPLDSLYNAGEKGRTGRGYGVQTFKIPKKSKVDDLKRKDEKGHQRRTSSVSRKKRYIEILDDSDESDANEVDDNSVPGNDSDVESVEEIKFDDLKVDKKKSGEENIEPIKNTKKIADKSKGSGLDTSRIQVIIKTGSQDVTGNELDSEDVDLTNFVSEYDKEFQMENNDKSNKKEVSESVNKVTTKRMKKSNTQYNQEDVQVEEPSSSKEVTDIPESDESVGDSSKTNIGETFITQLTKENLDVAFKKPAESVEADSSKKSDGALTPQERTTKSDEPSEQNILAHFFENLLKSNNKKDKKTALFSLIETFSDSFDTKEIQKIRKIINANEDEEEDSDEEESKSSQSVEKKEPMNSSSIPDSNITSHTLAVAPVQEEQPVVGSTTEEVPVDDDKGLQVAEFITSNEPLLAAETQVNEVTKSSEEIEPAILEETKSEESLNESNQSELTGNLEPVIVSVGERIKNRRRNLAPSKSRKKGKTELDMLHEDIQDMFIRDGVLTATGKRMCRILKDDPAALSVTNPETILEQPKKVRKKPGPKPKPKINKDEIQNSMKDMRIVIKKMPDNIMTTGTTRQLRSRNRQSSYAESDDESQKVTTDLISPHQLRSRSLQSSYLESDDDSPKSNNEIDDALPDDDESVKSEIDMELSSESGDEDNKSQSSDGVPKPKILRRRRGTKWASGIIPKNKKKKLPSKSQESSPYPSRASSPGTDDSIAEADFDKLVEPDKEYYYDYANKTKMVCKLCKYSGLLLTGHYLKEHPQSEVLCSRLAPHVATEAIKDFSVNGKKYESIINTKMSTKYQYCCRLCGFTSVTSPIFFYEHVTTHTGEYRHQCGICEYFAVTGKTMAGHFISAHPDQEKKAIRRTYTLAIVFGYICGECNFLQLKEKSVEDHANIFHLGVKPTIYKISMSTVLDPIFNSLNLTGEEPTALEPKLSDITISSSEVPSGSTTENEATETISLTGRKTRKKSGPRRKAAVQETRMEEENIRESPIPVQKKPGPKSKTMPFAKTTKQNKDTEKVLESPAGTSTEPIVETPPSAPIRKKPGPKSKTHKPKPPVLEETPTGDEHLTQFHKETTKDVSSEPKHPNIPDESIKEAPVRKRRRSLDKLISEDSGDDLDTIITLSSRSSRAAKEKATAKLKTLMESNEGLSTRKKSDTDLTRKEKDKEKSQSSNESIDEIEAEQAETVNDLNKETRGKEALNENQTEEMHPPAIKGSSSQRKDLNVFTCKTDMLEEEAKQIEKERLRTMEELNKSFGSRTSKLDFVDKLSDRLNNDQPSEHPRVAIKQEPKDDYLALRASAQRADTPTMPVLEKELPLLQPLTSTPPLTKVCKSPLATKKPVLEENIPLPQSSINIRQNKFNSLFSNMIEKLQDKVNEAAVQQQSPSTSSQSLNEETCNKSPRSKSPELLISIGDLISAAKRDSEIVYSCHANNCYVVTKDKMVFQLHCKFGHKDLAINSSLCDKCGVVIEITPDTSLLENLYDHLVFAHSDCLAKSLNLRMRRLSGDKLSVKQESFENKSVNIPAKDNVPQDFETALDRHVLTYLPEESTIHTVTASVEKDLPAPASQESVQVPMDAESSVEVSIPTTMPADVEIPNEEPVASEATLDIAEDNPFSFKIANVMSLAKSTESENQTTPSSPIKNKPMQQELPPLKPVPPLTLIGVPKQQPSVHQNHLVVKEAKLTSAELSRPKKAPKALQKFVDTPGNLYKCPHFYCMFGTNVRTFLERHLKAHQSDNEVMVPCVYCDMKTPWEHVPMHIDIRHATCRFACSYCLYRAYVKEYVCLHQEQVHPDKDIVVLALPPHRAAKKFSVADARIDSKLLCEPFRCFCRGEDGHLAAREYLFETEFTNHLNTAHKNKYTCCGYPGCNHKVNSSMMLNHWAMFHGVCTYQCAYCKTSSKEITRIYSHFSQQHPSTQSDILVRVNDNLPKDRELGYSKEAFEKLCHIRKVPQNLLSAIGKRSNCSVKLIHFSGSSEESTNCDIPESTSTGTSSSVTPLLSPSTKKPIQAVSPSQTQSKIVISQPNLQLLVASTTGGSEKLYLLPASMISPKKGQPVTSTAPNSNVAAQTSSASKNIVGQVDESELATESDSSLPRTSVSAITSSTLPRVPVKIGNTAIVPLGKLSQSTTTITSTSSSHATIAALSRSLQTAGSSLISQRPFATAGNKNAISQRPGTPALKNVRNNFPLVPETTSTTTIKLIETRSQILATNTNDFMNLAGDDATSQDGSTGLSEDDILQSAIQSILDADDLSESNSNNDFINQKSLDSSVNKNTSQGVFVNVGVTEGSLNISRPGTPEFSPVSKTVPPPLVLISNSSKSDTFTLGERTSLQPQVDPTTSTNATVAQEQCDSTLEQVAPVEHVDISGDIPDSMLPEDADPLNLDALESNGDSNLDPPLFDDINVDLDSPPEDPLTITPTFNSNLPSANDPLNIDDLVAATDPLEVSEEQGVDVISQSLIESSPGPISISSMRRSISMVSNSDDESDSSTSDKGKKHGLMGYQLYRCVSCTMSFSNVQAFKSHLMDAVRCKKPGVRQYHCVHCEKSLKTPQRLADHIQTHGVPRFSCSLCNEKFPIVGIAKLHMKTRHNIPQTNLVPLKSDRINMDMDEFMVKPGQANQPNVKDMTSDSAKQTVDENTFNPDQIDSIPIRQIFSNNVKCGKCNYQTKVRVNIVRHLQMHLEEKAVPDSAPVNPVPCLEKNEKMFDKMINLAASSITTSASRMGGGNQEKEEEKYPEFVPNHRRFVCSAPGCSYLCPEEGNLKHHLAALHSGDSESMCGHCKTKIEPTDAESVIKHLKLHGLHLYKCQYCSFVHHLKHKVEKHITDGHLDAPVKVVTLRHMESEPQEFGNTEEVTTPPHPTTTKFKPWRCCMCKVKCHTRDDIQSHIVHRHDIDTQYKCTLCAFKNDYENSFKAHFKEVHPNHEIDVIFVYQKVEEEIPKDDTMAAPFDTTPLWQRDKPRVRHIRGILFDEVAPQPTKSPKKPPKTHPGPSVKVSSGVSTAHSYIVPTYANKNLFDCIDAVARGTAETLQNRTVAAVSPSRSVVDRDAPSSSSKDGSDGTMEKVAVSEMVEVTKTVSATKTSSDGMKDDKQHVVVDPSDSGNDDVIDITQPPSIIVIDSDSDTEPTPVSKTDDPPSSKDKDSKTKSLSKTRGLKRQSTTTDLLEEAVKMAKIEEPDDEDSVMVTNCSKEHLISIYGLFGTPHNKQWKCPKCHQFKSKRVGDFMFHIYKDFNIYRYKCKACSDSSITYKYMLDHIALHPGFTEDIIEALAPNVKLETWIHMVVREQSLAILKNAPLLKKRPLTGPTDITCYFCQEKFMSMPDCCEHMLYHWVMMPYQCQHCPSEFYTVFDLKHHHKIEHPDLKLYLDPKGPTLTRALQCIENIKKRPPAKSSPQSPSRKKAKVDDSKDTKETNADVDVIKSGIVTNPKYKKGPKAAKVTPSTSAVDVIRIDDDEDDLVIVTKTENTTVPNEDEVFACDACAYLAHTEALIVQHLHAFHGIKLTNKFHTLSKASAETPSNQDMACNICDAVFSELKLRRHFLDNHLESHTFSPYRYKCDLCSKRYLTLPKVKMHFNRCHPGLGMAYQCVVETPIKKAGLKNKLYSCTMCSYTNICPNASSMRAHLRGHLRPIVCNYCNGRFRYHSEVQTHTTKEHPDCVLNFQTLEDVQREFTETLREISSKSTALNDNEVIERPRRKSITVKNVAKKSTSAPFMSPKSHSDEEEEYSFYGVPSDEVSLSNITTTFELDGLEYTTTAEQMMKMFNMDSFVDVSDCSVDIIPVDKS